MESRFQASRRDVLLGGSSAFAFAATGLGAETTSSLTSSSAQPAGFLGDRVIMLSVLDGQLLFPEPFPVTSDQGTPPALDPNERLGGQGRINGLSVNLTGGRNHSVSQMATPWPVAVPKAYRSAFVPRNADGEIDADRPSKWRVLVDGVPASVESVFRFSVPVRSAEIAPRDYAHVTRHMVTLVLDRVVLMGAEVQIEAPLPETILFVRHPDTLSETVHVCLSGYPNIGPKRGFVGQWLGQNRLGTVSSTDQWLSSDLRWRIVDLDTRLTEIEGNLVALPETHLEDMSLTGCQLYEADFTALERPGRYALAVETLGMSRQFNLAVRPYVDAFRLAGRFYYFQRSGIAREKHVEGDYTAPRNGHPADGLTVWQSDIRLSETSEGLGGPYAPKLLRNTPKDRIGGSDGPVIGAPNKAAWGGWHDAGDWDRRAQHLEVVHTLAWLAEALPSIRTVDFGLPESGRTFADDVVQARVDAGDTGDGVTVLPDIIHEALWGLSLWRRTQRPDGGIIGGVEYSQVGIIGSVSWDPVEEAYAYAPEPWAAYLFVMGAAGLGRVISRVIGDEVLGSRLIDEALRAWDWAEKQPEMRTREGLSESDMPAGIWQARVAASAVLYRASGNQAAGQIFARVNPFNASARKSFGLRPSVYLAQSLEYCHAAREGLEADPELCAAIIDWVRSIPKRDARTRLSKDFGLHTTGEFPWGRGWLRFGPGSNWPARRLLLALTVDPNLAGVIRDRVIEGMWFAMGCNPSNVSFVQGLGSRTFGDPLTLDRRGKSPFPGTPCFGVAGGKLHAWERERIDRVLYPSRQAIWPIYSQIFESQAVAICAEQGVKSNAIEWLTACALLFHLEMV